MKLLEVGTSSISFEVSSYLLLNTWLLQFCFLLVLKVSNHIYLIFFFTNILISNYKCYLFFTDILFTFGLTQSIFVLWNNIGHSADGEEGRSPNEILIEGRRILARAVLSFIWLLLVNWYIFMSYVFLKFQFILVNNNYHYSCSCCACLLCSIRLQTLYPMLSADVWFSVVPNWWMLLQSSCF